jgi:hypothetical protein
MSQTVQILRSSPPITLLPGALSVELGVQTKLWVGSGTGNRLLLSSDPVDTSVLPYLKLTGGTLSGPLTLSGAPTLGLHATTKLYVDNADTAGKAYADSGDAAVKVYVDNADALKAPLASPVFTGDPRAPTPAAGDNDTSIATTAFVQTKAALYLPLTGGILTGTLTVNPGDINVVGAINATGGINSTGVNAYLSFAHRDNPDTLWAWYSSAGKARLTIIGSSDVFAVDNTGILSIKGYEALAVTSNYTYVYSPSGSPSLLISGTGEATNYYRNGLHRFQNADASWTFLVIGSGNASVFYGAVFPGLDYTYDCGFAGNSWLSVSSYGYLTASDPAVKRDIEDAPAGALAAVMMLAPKRFRWKDAADDAPLHWGLLAPDVRDVMGEDFGGWQLHEESGRQSLLYNDLTALLWAAVRELVDRVTELEERKAA